LEISLIGSNSVRGHWLKYYIIYLAMFMVFGTFPLKETELFSQEKKIERFMIFLGT
jgi:uncharacterized membrane protein SirB2